MRVTAFSPRDAGLPDRFFGFSLVGIHNHFHDTSVGVLVCANETSGKEATGELERADAAAVKPTVLGIP